MIKAGQQQVQRLTMKQAFKGFVIAVVTAHDVLATAITTALLPNLTQVRVKLVDKTSGTEIYDFDLHTFYRFLKRGDRDLLNLLQGTIDEQVIMLSAGSDRCLQARNLLHDTYDGHFEFEINVGNVFQAGTQANSYIEVRPIESDEEMSALVVYKECHIDKAIMSEDFGNGIEEVILLRKGVPSLTGSDFYLAFELLGYTSKQFSVQMSPELTLANHDSEVENSIEELTSAIVLHNGEELSDFRLDIRKRNPAINNWVAIYRKVLQSNQAELSEARSDNRKRFAFEQRENA